MWDGFELLFRSLLASLLLEDACPPGCVVDAGAQKGHEACLFASSSRERRVHAIDPSVENVRSIRSRYGHRANLRAVQGALAERPAQGLPDEGPHRQVQRVHTKRSRARRIENASSYDVWTLDDLFGERGEWSGEALGLLHLE